MCVFVCKCVCVGCVLVCACFCVCVCVAFGSNQLTELNWQGFVIAFCCCCSWVINQITSYENMPAAARTSLRQIYCLSPGANGRAEDGGCSASPRTGTGRTPSDCSASRRDLPAECASFCLSAVVLQQQSVLLLLLNTISNCGDYSIAALCSRL